MKLFYAERYGDQEKGEPYIAERGVFTSIEEFVPYRKAGWSGTTETDTKADELVCKEQVSGEVDKPSRES